MALVKHLCSACGGEVTPGVNRCPHCAEALDWSGTAEGHTLKCAVCGYQNTVGNDVCQSCGARLAGTGARQTAQTVVPDRNRKKPVKTASPPEPSAQRRIEPWQIVSGIAVLGLIGFLLYLELSRPHESSSPTMSVAPPVMQPQMPSMQDVTPFERAVAANPKDPGALVQLANVLHDNGMYPRAIEAYKKYLSMKPDDPNARVDLGICYYQLGGQDSAHAGVLMTTAIQEMETALKGSPRHQPAAFNLGVVNLAMGNLEQSRTWFRKAVDLDKNSELGTRAQKMLDQHAFTPK